jgi:outer membrane protein assembly factor BamB
VFKAFGHVAFKTREEPFLNKLVAFNGYNGTIPENTELLWQYDPEMKFSSAVPLPTAPVTAGGLVFTAGPDGVVRALDAASGKLRWKAYTGGVLIEDGIAYVAAGIVDYDGTYVYALDVVTGRVKWRNETSGHLNAQARCGVSVQGHLLLNDGKLYLAGGNAVVIAEEARIVALSRADGRLLWSRPLPASPVEWGLAIDHHGRAVFSLKYGRILCFGRSS